MVSQAWKNLSAEERDEWEEMARRDKARYEVEKTMYTGPWKVPAKKRSHKDPNAPKRPMSAFLSFSNSKRAEVKAANPDIGNAEVSRILAKMWKEAPEEERKEHIDREYSLRQDYKTAIAEWRRNSDGQLQAARKEREDEALRAVLAKNGGMAAEESDQYSATIPVDSHTSAHYPPHHAHAGPTESAAAYHPASSSAPYPGTQHHSAVPPMHPSYPQHYAYAGYESSGAPPASSFEGGPYTYPYETYYHDKGGQAPPQYPTEYPHQGYGGHPHYVHGYGHPQQPPYGKQISLS